MRYKNIYHYIIVLIFYLIISFFLANYTGLDRHWSSRYDHEFTLIYNALLFNNGITIEYVQHPGYFTILNLSLFFKILSFLDFIQVDKLSLIKSENFNQSFQILVYYARIYSALCVAIFCTIVFFIFYKFSNKKVYSFILSLMLFSLPGTIYHLINLRTELMAMFFLALSFVSLKIFFQKKNKYRYLSLVCFFTFMIFGLINKMQIFFFLPLFLIPLYFSNKFVLKFDLKNFKFLENKFLPFILIFVVILYLYNSNNTLHPFPILSSLAILSNFFLLNLFFFFCIKDKINNKKIYLIVINITFIIVFFFVKNILQIHPSTSELIFINLTRIMHMAQYIPDAPQINDTFIFLSEIIYRLFANIYFVIKNYIFKINIYNILILSNLLILFTFRKKISSRDVFFSLSCICVSLLIILINSFRSNHGLLAQYNIFSDLFLILSFIVFAKLLKDIYLASLLVVTLWVINEPSLNVILQTKSNKNNIKVICSTSYLSDWHKKLEPSYYKDFCNKYNIK